MFMVVLIVLAIIGLGTLLSGAGGAGLAGLGLLGLAALLALKVLFFVALFMFIGRMAFYGGRGPIGRRPWGYRSRPRRDPEPKPSAEDRFEEWHRMAHAKEEVDSWVADLPDSEPQ